MNFQAFGRKSVVLYLAALAGCSDGVDLSGISGNAPVTPLSPPAQTGAPDNVVFFDDFQDQVAERWDTMEGQWTIEDRGGSLRAFAPQPREFGLAVAGRTGWRDYRVDADVTIQDDRFITKFSRRAGRGLFGENLYHLDLRFFSGPVTLCPPLAQGRDLIE